MIDPVQNWRQYGCAQRRAAGQELLAQGRVGCLVLAGGQGTRLGHAGPKGTFPIGPAGESLFELLCQRVVAASQQAGRSLPIAIMTSPQNEGKTHAFFERAGFFGLDSNQIQFIVQASRPLRDQAGQVVGEGPAGNGGACAHLVEQGVWDKWAAQGVRYLNTVLIDNPLADPFDPEMVGSAADVVIKVVERRSAEESVGLLVCREGKIAVVEYSEVDVAERMARDANGKLRHRLANLTLLCMRMPFVKIVAERTEELPWHVAYKIVKGKTVRKSERFLFDCLPWAEQVEVICYPRERCFAPLKNATGPDNPETVRAALVALTKRPDFVDDQMAPVSY